MKLFWQQDSTLSCSLGLGGYRSSVRLRSSLCGPEHGMGVIHVPEHRHLTPLPVSQGVRDVQGSRCGTDRLMHQERSCQGQPEWAQGTDSGIRHLYISRSYLGLLTPPWFHTLMSKASQWDL